MDKTQRLLTTDKHISAERIGQLRKIISTTKPKDLDLVVSDVKDNSKAIILATQSNQNIRNNKRKQKYLSEFVNNYLSSLNASDMIELTSIIEYYENLFENFTYDMEEDECVIIDEHYKKPIGQRIERLLKYGSIIPNNRKKSEFMEEMDFFVNRLKSYIENQAKIAGFSLVYLNADILLDFIRSDICSNTGEYNGNYDISYGTEVKESYLKSINFTASLPELYEAEDGFQKINEIGNHVKFELVFSKSGKKGLNKEEFINFLYDKGYKNDGGVFILGGNDHIQIKLVTYNKIVGANGNERFSLEIYSQAQKSNITSELFLELSMPEISYKTEQLINDIYREFGHPKQRFLFDMEMLIDEVSSYGDNEDDYENILEHNNDGKIIQGIILNSKGKETIQNTNYIQNIDFDLILEDSEMKEFNKLVEIFENEAIYKEFGVIIPKGMILYGPAGTGKTLFARKISEKINGEFITVKHTDIDDMYVGQAEKKIEKKFNEAEKIAEKGKKVILFFDEADSLFPKRGEKENHKEGVISVLLQKMDGIKKDSLDNIFVFFTTNRLKSIDSAVLSRFDVKLEIGLPKKEKRIEHFKLNVEIFKNKAKREIFGEIDYELLAQKTDGKSGRFIKQMVNNAVWNFAHNKISNNKDGLLSNQDILDCIKLIEKEENQSKGIGFTADIS